MVREPSRATVLSLCLPHALELELLTTYYSLLTTYYSLLTTHLPHALELELVDVVVEEGLELLEQLGALLLRVGLVPGLGLGLEWGSYETREREASELCIESSRLRSAWEGCGGGGGGGGGCGGCGGGGCGCGGGCG
eukprot:scaffold86984_cov49-Phaeocystis_antarctica.AAC.2